MTRDEIRETLMLTAISASTMISGVQDEREREELEAVFRDTFVREREAARMTSEEIMIKARINDYWRELTAPDRWAR